MTYLSSCFNMQGPLAQRSSAGDLSSAVASTCIVPPHLFLATQVLRKNPALILVRIYMLLYALMADRHIAHYLLQAPLQLQRQLLRLINQPSGHRVGVAACFALDLQKSRKPIWGCTPRACISAQLPADGGFVSNQHLSDLSLNLSGSHGSVNLISLCLAEAFVGH